MKHDHLQGQLPLSLVILELHSGIVPSLITQRPSNYCLCSILHARFQYELDTLTDLGRDTAPDEGTLLNTFAMNGYNVN